MSRKRRICRKVTCIREWGMRENISFRLIQLDFPLIPGQSWKRWPQFSGRICSTVVMRCGLQLLCSNFLPNTARSRMLQRDYAFFLSRTGPHKFSGPKLRAKKGLLPGRWISPVDSTPLATTTTRYADSVRNKNDPAGLPAGFYYPHHPLAR